jgi:hypothetical protein
MISEDKNALMPMRQRLVLGALIAGLLVIGVLSVKRIVNGNADLSGNYRIWRANLTEPTQPGRHMAANTGLQDPDSYLPVTYALFAPLATMPLPLLAAMWYVMNIACTVYLWRSLSSLLQESSQSPSNRRIVTLAAVAVAPSWIGTVLIGQHTLLQMSLIVAACRTDARSVWGSAKTGTLLAFAVVMKILPAVFYLPFLTRGNIRVLLVSAIVGCGLIFGLGSLYFGIEKNQEFHLRWLNFAIHGPESRRPDPRDPNTLRGSLRDKNQSIEAVLGRLTMNIPIHRRDPDAPQVNLTAVEASTWRIMSASLVSVCLLVGIIAIVRSQRANDCRSSHPLETVTGDERTHPDSLMRLDSDLGRLAILSLTQLFISPVIWSHYYVWLFFPLAFVLSEVRHGRSSGTWIYALWLILLPALGSEHCRAIGVQLWVNLAIYVWICWPALFPASIQHSGSAGPATGK